MSEKDSANIKTEKSSTPTSGGVSDSCVEIDGEEFEEARKDPKVRRLLERAKRYADSLRTEGRLD